MSGKLLRVRGERHKQQANNKPDGSDSGRIARLPPPELRQRKRLHCHASYRGEREDGERRRWPGHDGTARPLHSDSCLLPVRLSLSLFLMGGFGLWLLLICWFPLNKVFPQDFGFKLFLRCAASVLRGRWPEEIGDLSCPFSRAWRDAFQRAASNHGSCPFTWHQFWTEPEVCPLGGRIIFYVLTFLSATPVITKHTRRVFFFSLSVFPLCFHLPPWTLFLASRQQLWNRDMLLCYIRWRRVKKSFSLKQSYL